MSDSAVLHRRSSGIIRLLRGWIVALLAVTLAAGGHQAAHSMMHGATEHIPLQLLGFSAALTAPIAVALAGQRMSIWATAATTVVGQIVFHLLYSLPYSGAPAVHTSDHHHGHHGSEGLALLSEPHASHAMTAADAVMLAAHLLAAALTTFVIVHGERSLMSIVCWLTLIPVRVVLARLPVSVAWPKTLLPMTRVWIPHPMNVTQTRSTRGPPVLA